MEGRTLDDEEASRVVPVCGPGAYVILKALAFSDRGLNKDAYDLLYVIRHFGTGVQEIAEAIHTLPPLPARAAGLRVLESDFRSPSGLGPRRASSFLGEDRPEARADWAGLIAELLTELEKRSESQAQDPL